ncbi:GGDEF domain-containing protein [Carboxydothermus islandicus]|uniref:GGDEF domain-containing protein n=1 Tax=Carboxydothermus islandicus TaxID=661089 RepID=A0A1L8D2S1_9THEO|nr:GGDEF domain-containing protein [Carboxydothermus islandicus]GAV25381.1 GGDEF domain-containing protein [Carboxydothermus islandicus]
MIWNIFLIFQIVWAIGLSLLFKEVSVQANTDALTGLFNRNYFNKMLNKIKTKGPISLLLIDLDNFKNINDLYGHLAGDAVLQKVAEILKNVTRKVDIIVRWGGDEFAVVLWETEEQEALNIAQRIKTRIEDYDFAFGQSRVKISVSIGIASMKEDVLNDKDQLFKTADEALYLAKGKKKLITLST